MASEWQCGWAPRATSRKKALMAELHLIPRGIEHEFVLGSIVLVLNRFPGTPAKVYAVPVMFKTMSILSLTIILCSLLAAEDYPVGDKPFRRYVSQDRNGQRFTFYLSTEEAPARVLPLIVSIQGTGCSSSFVRVGDRIAGGLQGLLYCKCGSKHMVDTLNPQPA
jgi:hypothetical protein